MIRTCPRSRGDVLLAELGSRVTASASETSSKFGRSLLDLSGDTWGALSALVCEEVRSMSLKKGCATTARDHGTSHNTHCQKLQPVRIPSGA